MKKKKKNFQLIPALLREVKGWLVKLSGQNYAV